MIYLSYFRILLKTLPLTLSHFLVSLGVCHNGSENKMLVGSGFPGGSDSKESACNVGDLGSIPGSGRSPGEVNGNLFQYFRLGNPMSRRAWWATVHRVTER